MEEQISKVRDAYQKMIYRDVVKYGFHEGVSFPEAFSANDLQTFPQKYEALSQQEQVLAAHNYPGRVSLEQEID